MGIDKCDVGTGKLCSPPAVMAAAVMAGSEAAAYERKFAEEFPMLPEERKETLQDLICRYDLLHGDLDKLAESMELPTDILQGLREMQPKDGFDCAKKVLEVKAALDEDFERRFADEFSAFSSSEEETARHLIREYDYACGDLDEMAVNVEMRADFWQRLRETGTKDGFDCAKRILELQTAAEKEFERRFAEECFAWPAEKEGIVRSLICKYDRLCGDLDRLAESLEMPQDVFQRLREMEPRDGFDCAKKVLELKAAAEEEFERKFAEEVSALPAEKAEAVRSLMRRDDRLNDMPENILQTLRGMEPHVQLRLCQEVLGGRGRGGNV